MMPNGIQPDIADSCCVVECLGIVHQFLRYGQFMPDLPYLIDCEICQWTEVTSAVDFVDGALGTAEATAIVPAVCSKICAFDGKIQEGGGDLFTVPCPQLQQQTALVST